MTTATFPIRTTHAPIMHGTAIVTDEGAGRVHVSIRFGSDERNWAGEDCAAGDVDRVLADHEVERAQGPATR